MVLRLLEFVARHGVVLAAETERRLEAARGAFAEWCQVRVAMAKLKVYLSLPYASMALASSAKHRLMLSPLPLNGREW